MKVSDFFTQFINLEVNTDDTDSSDMAHAVVNTGLGYSGEKAMAIHKVEFMPPFMTSTSNAWRMAIATTLTAGFPDLDDKGVVSTVQIEQNLAGTDGLTAIDWPIERRFLPPIVIASPQLYLYAALYADEAAYRDKTVKARIHYTFVDINADLWRELFQTWNTVA